MKLDRTTLKLGLAGLIATASTTAIAQPDEDEIDVPIGITHSGQIGFLDFDFDELFGIDFLFTDSGTAPDGSPFVGLFTDDPGVRDLVSAGFAPTLEFAQPSGTFDFRFELLAIDAPLRMADPSFDNELALAGDTFDIGTQDTLATLGEIDSHPFYFIEQDNIVPGQILSVTGRVIDAEGTFTASEAFTFQFLVPAPGTALAFGAVALTAARRRRG
ncbi:MAG: hypothetical protein AAGF47_05895 [Planctomycetota bacterium]